MEFFSIIVDVILCFRGREALLFGSAADPNIIIVGILCKQNVSKYWIN
jgi:hypothetical protein